MTTAFLIFLLLLGLAVWTAYIEPRRLVIRHHRVALPHLRQSLTAVVVADLQPNSFHWPPERLAQKFREVERAAQPDLVFWLGDYYNAHTDLAKDMLEANPAIRARVDRYLPDMDEIAGAMTSLKGRLGSFAVLGNHDWAWSGPETEAALSRVGIAVLKDEIAEISDPRTGPILQVLGYEDMSSGRIPAYARVHERLNGAVAQIGLSHSPDAFPHAAGGPPLMLAGHTHGGQVRLPFLGALFLPLEFRQYDKGWFKEGGRRLFVTSGVGTSLPPLRLLNPPEIIILELAPMTLEERV